jgi:16S rRNA (cytidine1402-2'-O)-methyltransferase
MLSILGPERMVCLVRELTKMYETIRRDSIAAMATWVSENPEQQKGESVLILEGASDSKETDRAEIEVDTLLRQLLEKMSLKDTAHIAANITGLKKNALYERALEIQQQE